MSDRLVLFPQPEQDDRVRVVTTKERAEALRQLEAIKPEQQRAALALIRYWYETQSA